MSSRFITNLWLDLNLILTNDQRLSILKVNANLSKVRSNVLGQTTRSNEFKSMYTLKTGSFMVKKHRSASQLTFQKQPLQHKLLSLLKIFLRTNSFTNTDTFHVHASWTSYYFKITFGDGCVISIRKFFIRWKQAYYLLFNLFFYDIPLIVFGTTFFRKELLSFNWKSTPKLLSVWRYVSPFFFFKPSKIFDAANFIFLRLRMLGLNVALVLDITYHIKTLYYLNTTTFYTIGVVPINLNMHSVNFALPTSSDSLFTQLFFLRFFLVLKKSTKKKVYLDLQNSWNLWRARV